MIDGTIYTMMVHTISYAAPSSVTAYGDITYGSVSTCKAYVEKIDALIEKNSGETVNVSHKIWTNTALTMENLIWLPGESTVKANGRKPERVKAFYDLQGNVNHYEVWLGAI